MAKDCRRDPYQPCTRRKPCGLMNPSMPDCRRDPCDIYKQPEEGRILAERHLEVGHGGLGSAGLSLSGNLVNTPNGAVVENGAGIDMVARDTSFDNAGTLNMLFLGQLSLCRRQPSNRSFQGHRLLQHRYDIPRGWR